MSVGGSLINPGEINTSFLKKLKKFIDGVDAKFVLICGGGRPAREYMGAGAKLDCDARQQDWIGIAATMLNAELVRQFFNAPPVQQKPRKLAGKVIVAGGWKPGCSTDYDAVLWAKKMRAKYVVNLSNTDYVYTKDPRKFKSAKPIKHLTWMEYKSLIADKWSSGLSTPFDPIASRAAEKWKLRVGIINGKRFTELSKFLQGKPFVGTVIE